MRNRGQDVIIRGIEAVLIGLTFLAFAKAIWISLDIDESTLWPAHIVWCGETG